MQKKAFFLLFIGGVAFCQSTFAQSSKKLNLVCLGVQNDGAPLLVTKVRAKNKDGSDLKIAGEFGNSSLLTGTVGAGGWMNYFRSHGEWTVEQLKQTCLEQFPAAQKFRAIPMAQDGSKGFEWPLVNKDKKFYYLTKKTYAGPAEVLQDKNPHNYINYKNLKEFVETAFIPYKAALANARKPQEVQVVINTNDFFKDIRSYTAVSVMDPVADSLIYGVALLSPDKKYVLVSYKGTSNSDDIAADASLMLVNSGVNVKQINKYLKYAYQFYEKVKRENPSAKVIFTGHSLGGFLASMMALKTGELARTFSSPAERVVRVAVDGKTLKPADIVDFGFVPLPNVVNFYCHGDPVVSISGRHVASNITMPGMGKVGSPNNHHLRIVVPAWQQKDPEPIRVALNPDAILFGDLDPITKQLNHQGEP